MTMVTVETFAGIELTKLPAGRRGCLERVRESVAVKMKCDAGQVQLFFKGDPIVCLPKQTWQEKAVVLLAGCRPYYTTVKDAMKQWPDTIDAAQLNESHPRYGFKTRRKLPIAKVTMTYMRESFCASAGFTRRVFVKGRSVYITPVLLRIKAARPFQLLIGEQRLKSFTAVRQGEEYVLDIPRGLPLMFVFHRLELDGLKEGDEIKVLAEMQPRLQHDVLHISHRGALYRINDEMFCQLYTTGKVPWDLPEFCPDITFDNAAELADAFDISVISPSGLAMWLLLKQYGNIRALSTVADKLVPTYTVEEDGHFTSLGVMPRFEQIVNAGDLMVHGDVLLSARADQPFQLLWNGKVVLRSHDTGKQHVLSVNNGIPCTGRHIRLSFLDKNAVHTPLVCLFEYQTLATRNQMAKCPIVNITADGAFLPSYWHKVTDPGLKSRAAEQSPPLPRPPSAPTPHVSASATSKQSNHK